MIHGLSLLSLAHILLGRTWFYFFPDYGFRSSAASKDGVGNFYESQAMGLQVVEYGRCEGF